MSNVISIALDCILFICFVICMMGRRPIVLNKILSLSLSFVIASLKISIGCLILHVYTEHIDLRGTLV